jgi:hypothetical protein
MMKPFLLFGLLLGLSALSAQEEEVLDPLKSWEQTEAKWEELSHFEGKFAVTTPGEMLEKVDSIDTPLGDLVYHTFFLQPPSELAENEVYMISYVDYPEGTIHQDSTELLVELMDETQDAARESVRGELMFSNDGFQKDYPFRFWRIDYLNGRASIRTKAIVANNRFYTIQTVSRREYGMNHSTDRFIDSFRVF